MVDSAEIRTLTQPAHPADWTDIDTRAVDTARLLAADAVQKCGSGHPGTAMSLAPLAYTLFQRTLRHDPTDTEWVGRDRFILSCGHSSLTLYVQLYLGGFGLELDDLKALRTWGSLTPGHPEFGHTKGVEITTGPLGQGLASGVGMSMASRYERGLFDPDAAPGTSPFDHFIYVIASDGDIEEGVTSEASSLAGTQQLGNLIVFYDSNQISIEDNTDIALTENVGERYEAYGWHVQHVDGGENITGIEAAIASAKAVTDRPSIIVLRTVIGFPAPDKMNTGAAHGAALGVDEIAKTKEILGFDPEQSFAVADEVITHTRGLEGRSAKQKAAWQADFDAWASTNPERKELFDRLFAHELPEGWADVLPSWEPDAKGVATRSASGKVLGALAPVLPELWGGSADLAGSNNTTMAGAKSFGPASISTSTWTAEPYGRTLHFGIREHAMASILSGIVLHGPTRAYGGTFLQFADYMRPAVRLASLMEIDPIYVWTHDSIGLGEDGPTHQPVEQLAALRAIPHLDVVRPADANETAYAWQTLLGRRRHPVGLALTRQNVPVLEGTSLDGVAAGAYVLSDATGDPEVVLIGTGSEVQLAVEAQQTLADNGIAARVVSMPCMEWFYEQPQDYRDQVLPPSVPRVSVEAGIAMPWYRVVSGGEIVSLEHYGASADYKVLYEKFGITAAAVVAAAQRALNKPKGTTMTQNEKLAALSEAGVSVWLDDLSRDLIATGRLEELIKTRSVVGVTTNPSIFQAALSNGGTYAGPISELALRGADVDAAIRAVTTDDVRDACDVFAHVFEASDGVDGRVSIEVDPRLANDTEGTVEQAIELWQLVNRPNLFIKIPATKAGLPAITRVLAEGISVNVTLIFSVERYLEVIEAYLNGLDAAYQAGQDLSTLHSVASFFVSRVDTEIDKRLETIGTTAALELKGKAGLANARLAYAAYQRVFEVETRFPDLAAHGARPQRPLWASTGTKNAAYPDTLYVSELVAPHTVNTMPGKTMEAFADHGWVNNLSVIGTEAGSRAEFDAIAAAGVDLDDVFVVLETEGVEKFEQAWTELIAATDEQLAAARA